MIDCAIRTIYHVFYTVGPASTTLRVFKKFGDGKSPKIRRLC